MTDRLTELEKRLAEIVALCRRYNNSSVEPGTHWLAFKVLELAGEVGREREAGK